METILKLYEVKKWFPVSTSLFLKPKRFIKAVDGVSFDVLKGEKLCVVGESGSGKTTLGKIIAGVIKFDSGEIYIGNYRYTDLHRNNKKYIHEHVQMIFQDPYSSLNPRKTIRKILERPYKVHGKSVNEKVLKELLEMVGLSPPDIFLDKLPSQLSGGQRQRVVIARALALHPEIIVADEPVSMLDATIKIQILKLLEDLHKNYNITIIMISHEIPLIASFCDRVAVMYLGKILEIGSIDQVIKKPNHPYTMLLLSSVLLPDPDSPVYHIDKALYEKFHILISASGDINKGCRFHPRCPFAVNECREIEPQLIKVSENSYSACPILKGSR